MVLGVRHLSVNKNSFKKMFGKNINDEYASKINKLKKMNWMTEEKDFYKLTKEGSYYVDNISKMFYTKANKGQGQPWLKSLYNYIPTQFYKPSKS
jgi:coproporphyrinogen III oxidase-like Fe-S oxidoreductase